MSSHAEPTAEEPSGSLVLTDGEQTVLVAATETDDLEHDTEAETVEIEEAVEAVAEAEPVEEAEVDPTRTRNLLETEEV